MTPDVISVVKGRPTEEEVAALVAVLVSAAAGPPAPPAGGRGPEWRTAGLRNRAWRSPAAWSAGMHRWSRARP